MNQLETIMLALVGGTVVTTFYLWLRSSPIDAEAGIVRGPLAEPPTPDLLAFQCSACRRIRCVDGAWRPQMDVLLPMSCRVSHRLCDLCLAKEEAKLDAMTLPAAHDGKPVDTIRRGENGGQKLRPVFAGAEAFSNSITK